ncbi:hypothetical protein LCGC14_1825680 [marine sediment metagenome]|uniref:Uncharacterized protein n=1 Tax=marine sediment metagenome TaxID=412755 RepID=A0A0F9H5T9_9ZZZZ
MRRNKLNFIRKVIYRLKRSYGLPIDYYQLATHTMDPEDGDKVTTLIKTHIRRAVVLRARGFRSFVYDLAFISANKDFTEGGYFDPEDRKVIIDTRDVAIGFSPQVDDYFIFQSKKYEVKEIFDFEDNNAFIFLARRLRGALVVRTGNTLSVLDLTQTASSETQNILIQNITSVLALTQNLKEVP